MDTKFGEVVWSEFDAVRYNDVDMNVDWALVRVRDDRVGINYARQLLPFKAQKRRRTWVPRDLFGVYFVGLEDLEPGVTVSKTGRRTGSTFGRVSRRYALAKLDTSTYTTEFAVLNEVGPCRFSNNGDSGAAVFDTKGQVGGWSWAGAQMKQRC